MPNGWCSSGRTRQRMTTRSALDLVELQAEQGDETARQVRHLHGSASSIIGGASLAGPVNGETRYGSAPAMGENR